MKDKLVPEKVGIQHRKMSFRQPKSEMGLKTVNYLAIIVQYNS